MPIAFLIVGIVLLVAATRGTQDTLFTLVKGDFTGPNNFLYWVVAIVAVGMLGYIPRLKHFSTAFLVLIGVVILLSHRGFFAQLQEQLSSTESGATQNV